MLVTTATRGCTHLQPHTLHLWERLRAKLCRRRLLSSVPPRVVLANQESALGGDALQSVQRKLHCTGCNAHDHTIGTQRLRGQRAACLPIKRRRFTPEAEPAALVRSSTSGATSAR